MAGSLVPQPLGSPPDCLEGLLDGERGGLSPSSRVPRSLRVCIPAGSQALLVPKHSERTTALAKRSPSLSSLGQG